MIPAEWLKLSICNVVRWYSIFAVSVVIAGVLA